jgi:hypothetical protein
VAAGGTGPVIIRGETVESPPSDPTVIRGEIEGNQN